MTIKDVIDYVDRIKKNEFTTEEKTRWINEIEGYVQIQIMLLAQPECISYCYSSESEQSGISFPADNQMRLPRKLKAHVGGFLKIEGLVTYPENNLSGLAILSISDNGKLIEFEQGTFPQTGETPESAIAQIAFDGQDTELLVPAPFERLYYEYVLAKISENLEENSAQNNRLATFDETWQNYAEWYANAYKPGDGKAVFKGYYIAGKQGVPGPAGPPGKNVYNVRLTTSAESITADKTYAELTEQLEAGVMVIPVVDGKAFTSNAVKTDNTIVFTSAEDGFQPTLKGYSVNASDEWTVFTVALPTTAQVSAKYTKPASGIPKADLANDVQASLDKAENAVEYFEVTLTAQDGVLAADKTFEQVKAAVADGKPVLKVHSDGDVLWFFLLDKSSAEIDFVGFADEQILAYLTVKQDDTWETTVTARVTAEMLSALSDKLGNLGNLTTTAKNNLVAAINEVKQAADKKQDKLIAGENITIAEDGKTISATGAAGAAGKSAYQYAVEGGYTGTETKFAEKLASGTMFVTITDNNGTLSADKSYNDIENAILDGTPVLVDYAGTCLPLIGAMADAKYFGTIMCDDNIVATSIIEITQNGEVNDISAQIDIPKTLPNPHAITFTGAVTGTYDGSNTKTVNIPSAVTDDHINSLIDTKLGVIENGSY